MAVGIENLKTALVSLGDVGEVLWEASADGKIGLSDLPKVLGLAGPLTALSGVDWSQIDDEIKDLDATESTELLSTFSESFDLPGTSVDDDIEAGLVELKKIADGVLGVIAIGKRRKRA